MELTDIMKLQSIKAKLSECNDLSRLRRTLADMEKVYQDNPYEELLDVIEYAELRIQVVEAAVFSFGLFR